MSARPAAGRRLARLLLPLALPALLAADPAWTADSAVATALRQNPDAALARLRWEAAAALVAEARAAWRPRLDLTGRYTQTNSPVLAFSSVLNQRALAFDQDFNHPERTDNLGLTGTLAYTLYHGGRSATRRAAVAGTRAADQEARATRHQLAVETIAALLHLRQAREAVTAALAAAVIEAGAVRFRPMLLTALAVIVGASVILADPIFQGLALSLMAGEVASLLISRFAVPIPYYMTHARRGAPAALVSSPATNPPPESS